MIDFKPFFFNNASPAVQHIAERIATRLQSELNWLHNAHRPFGTDNVAIKDLKASADRARTLTSVLYLELEALSPEVYSRIHAEIHSAYANATLRVRRARGQTPTA